MSGLIHLDPQANGWADDGSESGVIRVRPLGAGVVRYPILPPPQTFIESANGGGFITQPGLFADNPDGTHRVARLATTTTLGSFARLNFRCRGRLFGVSFRRATAAVLPEFAVLVDGEAVYVAGTNDVLLNRGITGSQFIDVASVITHRNLDPDIDHYVEIVLSGSTTQAKQLDLFDFLVDGGEGYQPAPRAATRIGNGTLTTTDTAISLTGAASERIATALDCMEFTNTDTVTRIVKIKTAASSGSEIARLTLAAGASDFWPKSGMPRALSGEAMSADAAGVVNYTTWGVR